MVDTRRTREKKKKGMLARENGARGNERQVTAHARERTHGAGGKGASCLARIYGELRLVTKRKRDRISISASLREGYVGGVFGERAKEGGGRARGSKELTRERILR